MTEEERNKEKQKAMFDSGNIISLYSYLAPPLEWIIKQTSQEEIQQTCSEAIHLQSGLKEHSIKDHDSKVQNPNTYKEVGQHEWELSETIDNRFRYAQISDTGILWHEIQGKHFICL